jgi:hypothetical protein
MPAAAGRLLERVGMRRARAGAFSAWRKASREMADGSRELVFWNLFSPFSLSGEEITEGDWNLLNR